MAMLTKQEKRKQMINLAMRRQRPGSGSLIAFLKKRTAVINYPDLSPVLDPIPWAVVGAVATRLYMPERLTQDLDIVIRKSDSGEAQRRLVGAGFNRQGRLSVGGWSWLTPDGRMLDVVESSEDWLDQALAEARNNRDRQGLPVLPLPYLVLVKYQSGRLQDLADISRMLGQADQTALERVRELFSKLSPEDREDLESLITLGQLEMKEPGGH
ncbi:MAG: hypothetical protein HY673_20590 [Chloroflexi bacterium]|nr:hypothetical protein [Chloroflexota bacterium]